MPHRTISLLFLLFAVQFAFGRGEAETLIAASNNWGELCSVEAIQQYARLNLLAASAQRRIEHAAFLLRRKDGRLAVLRWQTDGATGDSATYRGRIPANCLAIIHTHPPVDREPSRHDIAEAQRIRLSIVVITPLAVTVASPDGTTRQLFGPEWTGLVRHARIETPPHRSALASDLNSSR